MASLIQAKVEHLESMVDKYREQRDETQASIKKLNWWYFGFRFRQKRQVLYYDGIIKGLQMSINALNDRKIRHYLESK